MASDRQIAANRLNARRSTGPRTLPGKLRSRRNAVRHGLTAETVIGVLEDAEDYRAFEKSVVADYAPRSALEHQLLVRLASLLWRLRRATAIETGLLQIQGQILQDRRRWAAKLDQSRNTRNGMIAGELPMSSHGLGTDAHRMPVPNGRPPIEAATAVDQKAEGLDIARSFLRLANLEGGLLERLGHYEVRLWRQLIGTLSALKSLR